MDVRSSRASLLLAMLLLIVAARPTAAAIDISGRWGVVIQSFYIGPQDSEWDIEQTGTAIVVTITFTGPYLSETDGPYTGTIDPVTGLFHVDLPDASVPFPFPPCPDSRIDGTAAADAQSISGQYQDYFFSFTPTLYGCNPAFGAFDGMRCGPGVDACCPGPSCCGNGVVADGEECDDGNQVNGDCCSATCTATPAGTPCSDNNACTDDLGCDGAGMCQHADNSNPCGTTCLPATCTGGTCHLGTPTAQGEPCNDGNACTSGDHCNGTGNCLGGSPVTCTEPCQACGPVTGCVAVPLPELSCDASAQSALVLSVANPAKSKVAWTRKDDLSGPQLAGDPTATAAYDICVFDGNELIYGAATLAAGTCNGTPCWRATRTGYRYRDPSGSSGGLRKIRLRGSDPSFDLSVKAKGPSLLPASLAGGSGAPVVAELRAHTPVGFYCWQSRFDQSTIQRSSMKLRARN